MEHFIQLCRDHGMLVYIIMGLFILAGVGIGVLSKNLIPALIKIFRRQLVEVNVNPDKSDPDVHPVPVIVHGPSQGYCEICPEHPEFRKFVSELRTQQVKNVEMITSIRIVQENNLTIITEITRQQTRIWQRLDEIPDKFGEIRGQLGEIKGMIKTLHTNQIKKL